ncbi:hypothetical protein [Micromonospora sp. NPDC005324]|uniref:hypothetical protein n=1 Tax=Micromonospora sp. NPDC005324 TaxID=3157033 RepID=UPI00339EA4DD
MTENYRHRRSDVGLDGEGVPIGVLKPGDASTAGPRGDSRRRGVERLLARPDVQTVLNLTIPAAHADISLKRDRRGQERGETGTLAVPDPNDFDGEVRLFTLVGTAWRLLEPQAGYVGGSRGIGLIDLVGADGQRPLRAGGDVALHLLEAMTALLQSAAQGQRIELTTVVERPGPGPLTPAEDWKAHDAHGH